MTVSQNSVTQLFVLWPVIWKIASFKKRKQGQIEGLEVGSTRHVWQFYKAAIMEKSKTRPLSNTVVFSSIFFSVAVCFVALIHVEIELYAHRQMLRVLTQQNEENREMRSTITRHEETIGSVLKMLHSDAGKGENKIV